MQIWKDLLTFFFWKIWNNASNYAVITSQLIKEFEAVTEYLFTGYTYAGLQSGVQCWCGDSGYAKYGEPECGFPCPGNDEQFCGGDWHNSVYEIGIK